MKRQRVKFPRDLYWENKHTSQRGTLVKNAVSSPLAGRHQRVKDFYVYVVWANAKTFPVKWTWHSNKEIAHNIDRSVSLPFSNSCFISLISVVEPDKRNIPWWSKPVNKHKSKRKNKFTTRNKQTNKQKNRLCNNLNKHRDIVSSSKQG